MNKRQRKVFSLLRTKTKAFGLNRKELEGLALKIDKNLQLEDDASDEDVDAAIEDAIEAAIPFLELSQSVAQRTIQSQLNRLRDNHDDDDDDDTDDDDDSDDDPNGGDGKGQQRKKGGKGSGDKQKKGEESELMKLIRKQSEAIELLKGQLNTMQGDRVAETRKTKLKKLVENTGTFGKSVLKQFDLMTFKDDDAFEDYLDGVRADLDELNQERANQGLAKLGEVPRGGKQNPEQDKPEEMSDDEIVALAGGKKEN